MNCLISRSICDKASRISNTNPYEYVMKWSLYFSLFLIHKTIWLDNIYLLWTQVLIPGRQYANPPGDASGSRIREWASERAMYMYLQ